MTIRYFNSLFLSLAFVISVFSQGKLAALESTNLYIIPAPNHISIKNGISNIHEINISPIQGIGNDFIIQLFGQKSIKIKTKATNVVLMTDPKMADEEYLLIINKDNIVLTAKSSFGFQYALVSLAQLTRFQGFPLPMIEIHDEPKYSYRGMHLDVARHFFGVNDVKKYLDYMAYYKFNHFHWHLTDDQGWRIEIKKYPKLQDIAAFRKETLIGHYNDQPHQFDGRKYGGFYTQEEIKEIVAYAADRNIEVIPEIEMPCHALAAISAYPALGCENKSYQTGTVWGVFDDVFCPNEVTFSFLQDVMDEVVALFPGKYIHIGGDECPKDAWKKSAFCQALIKDKNLVDEHGLQSYFINRMEKYINEKGKKIIGWDEILEGGLAPNATVMSWRGIQGGMDAARQHHPVIMTPGSHCYFDYYQSENPSEPLAIGGYTTLEKVYSWDLMPSELEVEYRKYILGGQSNLWSEYISKYEGVEYMVYSRGMAMSESLWSDHKDYRSFVSRYLQHYYFWVEKGAKMAFHLYDLKPKISAGNGMPISLTFDPSLQANIKCIMDGGNPKKIDSTIQISQSGKYLFTASNQNHTGKPLELNFHLHKATKAILTLENLPAPQYDGNGIGSLVNGIKGGDHKYGGTEWLGFNGKDLNGILDFGEEIRVEDIHFRFFKAEGQWIYLPKELEILVSSDGQKFTLVHQTAKISTISKVADVSVSIGKEARFIKFNVRNYGIIPEGAQGSGNPAWLFVDEIVVE